MESWNLECPILAFFGGNTAVNYFEEKREHFLAMEAVQRVMEQYRWSSDIEALSNSDAIRDSFVKKIRKIVWKELLSAVFPWPTVRGS